MTRQSQKEFVRNLLIERGDAGVSAHELTYLVKPGITRAAAIIFDLRKGDIDHPAMNIETINKPGRQAHYVLRRRPLPPPAAVGARPRRDPPVPGQAELFEDLE